MASDDPRVPAGSPLVQVAVRPEESVVVTVVRALAAVENVAVTDLPALSENVDPDALEDLVTPSPFVGTVTFEFDDYVVHVEAGESVTVYGAAPDR